MAIRQLTHAVRGRSRTVRRTVVVAGGAVLALASLGTATAGAASPPTVGYYTGTTTITAGGHRWQLSVDSADGYVGIYIAAGDESDSWSFLSFPASDLKVNAATGEATLDAHNALAPVAFLNLKFTVTKHTKESCKSGSETAYSGTSAGSVSLTAGSTGLKLKSAHASFRYGAVIVDRNCVPRTGKTPPTPCYGGYWSISEGAPVTAAGSTPGVAGQEDLSVGVSEDVSLKAPHDAYLGVDVLGTGSKPVFNKAKKQLTVTAGPHGPVTGSAVLSAVGTPYSSTSTCTQSGKKYKEHMLSYAGTYVSSKGEQFEARSAVAGLLKVAATGSAAFDLITFTRS
jgi:hypothetical protein